MLLYEPDELFNLLLIETHNRCNRKCWFCKFGQPRGREPRQLLEPELLHKLVAELQALNYDRRISWVGINEPLLDRRLEDFIGYTRAALPRCFQSVITNGDLLTLEGYDRLRAAGLDSLAISVYDPPGMDRAGQLQAARPEIVVWDQRPYNDPAWAVSPACADFTNRAGQLAVPVPERPMIDRPCAKPATGISVLPDGRVPLCSDDMYGDVVMGNVRDQSLWDIWHGPRFRHYRRQLRSHRHGLELCATCSNKGGPHVVRFP